MKSAFFWIKLTSAIAVSSLTYFSNPKSNLAETATRLNNFPPQEIEIFVPPPETDKTGFCSQYVEGVIDKILARPTLQGSKWAILIQTIGGKTVYSHNPDSYMIPASNLKLLVTAAALQKLNPEGKIRSSSVRDWIVTTNLRSDNDYANILLSFMGGYPSVQQALSQIGVNSNGYRMRDGSGLSRNNLATPRTLVNTLRAMHSAKGKDIFLASLPIAGETGTLKNRLQYTSAQGTVRAKTGTLRGVRALSGYVDTSSYGTLAFSAIANQPTNRSDSDLVKALDEIVLRLSTISACQ
jgi:serine-type D-Ala-D-Ala carboxypeptidase/endopeptidase (penicillin-binding protein 4)